MTVPAEGPGGFGPSLGARWHAAVANLQAQTERVQATADALPRDVTVTAGRLLRPDPFGLLRRHTAAAQDYMTALACVQALLVENGLDPT